MLRLTITHKSACSSLNVMKMAVSIFILKSQSFEVKLCAVAIYGYPTQRVPRICKVKSHAIDYSKTSNDLAGTCSKPHNAPSNLALLGRYILPPLLFKLFQGINPDQSGEIQLTDALSELLAKDGLNAILTDADIFDCGNKLGYLSANLAMDIWTLDQALKYKQL